MFYNLEQSGTLQYERAIQDYDEAILLDSQNVNTYIDRGNAKRILAKFDEAIEDYTKAFELNPEDDYVLRHYPFIDLALAGDFRNEGDSEQALSHYDLAIETAPRFVEAYLDRGTLYQDLRKHNRAIQDYAEGIRVCEEANEALHGGSKFKADYAQAYALRGFAYREIGKSKEASQDLEKSAELGNSTAIEFLAQNSTTSKHTSKWGWFKSNFGSEAAQRRAGMNPLQQTKDAWGALKELREIKGTHKSGEESNDKDSGAKSRK
jgi:tetratricopeptide (TPR) repeat protein